MPCHEEYTENLPAPPGPMKPAGFSKAWPGRTESLPAIYRLNWPLANTGGNWRGNLEIAVDMLSLICFCKPIQAEDL